MSQWVRDVARDTWVQVKARPSMTVFPEKATKQPLGFVIPEPEPAKTAPKLPAGGWAKR